MAPSSVSSIAMKNMGTRQPGHAQTTPTRLRLGYGAMSPLLGNSVWKAFRVLRNNDGIKLSFDRIPRFCVAAYSERGKEDTIHMNNNHNHCGLQLAEGILIRKRVISSVSEIKLRGNTRTEHTREQSNHPRALVAVPSNAKQPQFHFVLLQPLFKIGSQTFCGGLCTAKHGCSTGMDAIRLSARFLGFTSRVKESSSYLVTPLVIIPQWFLHRNDPTE